MLFRHHAHYRIGSQCALLREVRLHIRHSGGLARRLNGLSVQLLLYLLRLYAVSLIVCHLLLPAAVCLVYGLLHTLGYSVAIHYHLAIHISRSASRRLCQRAMRTQEAFLVGIQDGHQRHLGQVQSLSQQVDAHQHIIHTGTQVAQYLYPVKRRHVRVYVVGLHSVVQQILRQLLSHTFGKCRNKHTLITFGAFSYFFKQIINLVLRRPHFNGRVKQSRRAYHLFHNHALGSLKLILRRSGRDIDDLICHLLKLLKSQRSVVKSRRQSEAIFHQVLLP